MDVYPKIRDIINLILSMCSCKLRMYFILWLLIRNLKYLLWLRCLCFVLKGCKFSPYNVQSDREKKQENSIIKLSIL